MSQKTLPQFFSAADLGKSFREVATNVIRTENQDILNRWYHSAKDADLFVWFDSQKNIIKQQLSFYGQAIEWNVIEGTRTGCVLEEDGPDDDAVHKRRSSDVIQFDQDPQNASLKQALDLLNHITVLRDDERRELVDNFSRRKTVHNMDPGEFVRRFGGSLNQRPSAKKSLLAKLLNWLIAR
jgi:hypothetical protein